jgi:formate-dependent nitrite reductase membrane component NrfD
MIVLVLELLTLAALVVSLGSLARVWLNAWGAVLVLGVVGIGIVVPLLLHARAHTPVSPTARLAAVLVLVGGFLLRVVIVLSSEAI